MPSRAAKAATGEILNAEDTMKGMGRRGACALLVLAAACGRDATGPAQPGADAATITIAPAIDTLRAIGAVRPLAATVRNQSGQVLNDVTVTWSSLAPAIASVSPAGVVVAVGPGTARVVARAGTVADTADVVVRQVPVALAIAPQAPRIGQKDTVRLSAVPVDANGVAVAGLELASRWRAEAGAAYVDVDSTGLVVGVFEGSATVVAHDSVQVDGQIVALSGEAQVAVKGLIVYAANGGLFVVNDDGTGAQPLADWAGLDSVPAGASDPAWSPDGRRLAISQAAGPGVSNIVVLNLVSGFIDRRTSGMYATGPSWSADGSRLVYARHAGGADTDLEVTFAVGALKYSWSVINDAGDTRWPAWSPDGTRIAFQSDRAGLVFDIWTVPVSSGGTPTDSVANRTGNNTSDLEPSWSAEGDRLVYICADESSAYHVCVADADGSSAPARIATVLRGSRFPSWSLDGSSILISTNGVIRVMNADGSNQRTLYDYGAGLAGRLAWRPAPTP
jgi:hypothetical protein